MSQSHEGKRVPNVTFRTRVGGEWRNITTDEIFKGKNVVVFSLPGAFTPTCSSTHVPGYNELAPAFFANGIDSIVCISNNYGPAGSCLPAGPCSSVPGAPTRRRRPSGSSRCSDTCC